MTETDTLRSELLNEIENSGIRLEKKLRLMELMDKAFRQHLGTFFLSNEELEQRDILNRSF